MGTTKEPVEFLHSDLTRRPEAEALALNTHRLDETYSGRLELLALNYLVRSKSGGNGSLETSLVSQILCATIAPDEKGIPAAGPFQLFQAENYSLLSEDKRRLAEALKGREQELIIMLRTLFQWFGTGMGRCALEELLETFKAYDAYQNKKESGGN